MKDPKKLPPIDLLQSLFSYDPHSGDLISLKTGKPVHAPTIRVGKSIISKPRICFALYFRCDPINYRIVHIDGNLTNNRINNLKRKKI